MNSDEMIHLSDSSKIYILAPLGYESGGPEALHQLAHALTGLNRKVSMAYIDPQQTVVDGVLNLRMGPVPRAYAMYEPLKSVGLIEDAPANLIIVPEIWADLLDKIRFCQKAIWWLAVPRGEFVRPGLEVHHLVQSAYAAQYLSKNGITNYLPLSDYISLQNTIVSGSGRRDVVLYNPAKGLFYSQSIMHTVPDVEFRSIQNLDRQEVGELMEQCKVYMDFGPHPGKDRLPREAARSGLCIVVANSGSAANFSDMPIAREFKFPLQDFDPSSVGRTIRELMGEYCRRLASFEYYRRVIESEKKLFDTEVYRCFGEPSISGPKVSH